MTSKPWFLLTLIFFNLALGCISDDDCSAFWDPCLVSECIEPECHFVFNGNSTCSSIDKCEPGFFCSTNCKCEETIEHLILITKQRADYCDKLIKDYLIPKNEDASLRDEMSSLLTRYYHECENSEGEFMSVKEFILLYEVSQQRDSK